MIFDWTFSLSSVIQFGGLIISLVILFRKMRKENADRMEAMHRENSDRMAHMERTMNAMNLKMGYLWAWFAREHNMPTTLLVDGEDG